MSSSDRVFRLYEVEDADSKWFVVERIFHRIDICMASNFHGFDCASNKKELIKKRINIFNFFTCCKWDCCRNLLPQFTTRQLYGRDSMWMQPRWTSVDFCLNSCWQIGHRTYITDFWLLSSFLISSFKVPKTEWIICGNETLLSSPFLISSG